MASARVNMKGIEELEKVLRQFPDHVKRVEIRRLLRKAGRPTLNAAKAKAPKGSVQHSRYPKASVPGKRASKGEGKVIATYDPQNLSESLGFINARTVQPQVYLGPRSGKKATGGKDGYYGHMIEYGHKAVNGEMVPAQPFMRPAYEQTKGAAAAEAAKGISKYIEKQANRLKKKL